MAKRDFYEVLGVTRDADAGTIKKAYRKLAMQFHPDKNPGDKSAEEKFREAAEAYDVLSDEQKKQRYDQFGHAGLGGQSGGAGFRDMDDIFSSFGDIFGDFFGGGMGGGAGRGRSAQDQRKQVRRGADLRYVMSIDLAAVMKGAERDIEFDTEQNCGTCHGSGSAGNEPPKTCHTCGGRGQVLRSQGFFQVASTCPTCRGTGEIIVDPCRTCSGKGRVPVKRRIRVNVPAGVDNGTRLRVAGEGEGGFNGGPAGDLFVELRVEDHKKFTREGLDLFADIQISYLQAILGGEQKVKTVLDEATIEIPEGTQSGDLLRLRGEGVPSLRSGARGDILYRVNVEIPTKLLSEERKLLEQIAQLKGSSTKKKKAGLFG